MMRTHTAKQLRTRYGKAQALRSTAADETDLAYAEEALRRYEANPGAVFTSQEIKQRLGIK